jgi:hypothetical protein
MSRCIAVAVAALLAGADGLSLPSRREVVGGLVAGWGVGASLPAWALPSEETPRVTTRMGGLLEAFQDGGRSIRMMVPSGE